MIPFVDFFEILLLVFDLLIVNDQLPVTAKSPLRKRS